MIDVKEVVVNLVRGKKAPQPAPRTQEQIAEQHKQIVEKNNAPWEEGRGPASFPTTQERLGIDTSPVKTATNEELIEQVRRDLADQAPAAEQPQQQSPVPTERKVA